MQYFNILLLFLAVFLNINLVYSHPFVSSPRINHRGRISNPAGDAEDLYAKVPRERPLHTTVLMAMATGAAPRKVGSVRVGSGVNVELR